MSQDQIAKLMAIAGRAAGDGAGRADARQRHGRPLRRRCGSLRVHRRPCSAAETTQLSVEQAEKTGLLLTTSRQRAASHGAAPQVRCAARSQPTTTFRVSAASSMRSSRNLRPKSSASRRSAASFGPIVGLAIGALTLAPEWHAGASLAIAASAPRRHSTPPPRSSHRSASFGCWRCSAGMSHRWRSNRRR